MDMKTLRLNARLTQADAARLAGVSVRTWRRWEKRQAPPLMVLRWLRYEAGYMPGWPSGFRLTRDGIVTPSGDMVRPGHVEGFRWLLGLLDPAARAAAYDWIRSADDRAESGRS